MAVDGLLTLRAILPLFDGVNGLVPGSANPIRDAQHQRPVCPSGQKSHRQIQYRQNEN